MPCGHSHYTLWPFPMSYYALWAPATFLFQRRPTPLRHALWAFPTAVICHVGIPNPHSSHCAPYALWSSACPVGLPHYHQYTPWAFTILPCGYSHSHMPCGHSQQAPMPRGHAQRFLFQWRLTLPWHAPWAFPIAAYMPCGHSQSWYFILCPYDLWSSVRPVGLPPWPPICPVGISHSALWAFPYAYGHSQQAPMPVGISHSALWPFPFPYALWAFPTSANVPWAPSTLSFSVKIYPAMTYPVGFPNGCLYGRWAFPILIFHTVPHMTCGHQYALLAYSHGHQYALWAFPVLPCGHSHFHMPCGLSQQGPMPCGHSQRFLFQRRLHLPWYALWAFAVAAYMPCGHSQSSHFILCLICPVVISKPRRLTPMATNMPRGHFPFHPALGAFPYAPWAFPTSANVPWAPATFSISEKT